MITKMFFITNLLLVVMITLHKTKKSLILLFDAYINFMILQILQNFTDFIKFLFYKFYGFNKYYISYKSFIL